MSNLGSRLRRDRRQEMSQRKVRVVVEEGVEERVEEEGEAGNRRCKN